MVPTDNNDGFVTVASATGQLQVPNVPGTGTPTKTPLAGTPTPTATPGPASQSLPWLNYLFVANVNHDSIRVGHNSFSYIQAVLQRGTPVPTAIVGPLQISPSLGPKSAPAGG